MTRLHSIPLLAWISAAALFAVACTANPPVDARPVAAAVPSAPPAPAAAPAATPTPAAPVAQAEKPATAPAAAPASDPVNLPSLADPPAGETTAADPAADPAPVDPAAAAPPTALAAASISPLDHAVTWRDVATLPADSALQGFQYFATGVLAGAAPAFFTLDDTGTWSAATLDVPPGSMSGHFPDETWSVQYSTTRDRAAIGRMRVHRLRGLSRWVPQTIKGEQWIEDGHLGPVRKSWNVGFLALDAGEFVRVAGGSAPDPASPLTRGYIVDFVESKGGDVYTLSHQDSASYVQTACFDDACVQASATPLPPGNWEWLHTIPRQKHSISISLHDNHSNTTNNILHYETGGWKLETLPDGAQIAGIWPTPDGGMWAQTADALFHRDPAGAWRRVALPAEFAPSGPVFAAMTRNMGELVILGTRGGTQVVLATAAKAQTPV